MFPQDSTLMTLNIVFLVLGVGVAVGGGLLALVADPERPLQCIPVFALATSVFIGGIAILCWFAPLAEIARHYVAG